MILRKVKFKNSNKEGLFQSLPVNSDPVATSIIHTDYSIIYSSFVARIIWGKKNLAVEKTVSKHLKNALGVFSSCLSKY